MQTIISNIKKILFAFLDNDEQPRLERPPNITVPLSNIDFKMPKEYRKHFETRYVFTNHENKHCYLVFNKESGQPLNTVHMSGGGSVIVSKPDKNYYQ